MPIPAHVLLMGAAGRATTPQPTFAYFAGGYTTSDQTTIDKYVYATDTRSTPGSGLAAATRGAQGLSNPTVALYFASGTRGTAIDKFTAAESRSTLAAVSSTTRNLGAAINDNAVSGYFAGGYSAVTSINKLNYSTDGVSTLTPTLATVRWGFGGLSDTAAGYFCGGSTGAAESPMTNVVEKITYATDALSTISATMPASTWTQMAGISGPGNVGRLAGTWDGLAGANNGVTFTFGTETMGSSAALLTTARGILGGAYGESHGYMAGGYTGSNSSVVDKIPLPTGGATAITALASARRGVAGASA